jgi:hypothetical protein
MFLGEATHSPFLDICISPLLQISHGSGVEPEPFFWLIGFIRYSKGHNRT